MKHQVREGVALGALLPVAVDLDQLHEAAAARRAEIEAGDRYTSTHKSRLIAEVDAELDAQVQRVLDECRKASMRPLDAEEGQVRAALRDVANDPNAQFREARASRFASLMQNALGPDDIDRIWTDVRLTGDADAIGAAASAGLKRLSDLAAVKKAIPTQHAALQARFAAFEHEVAEWSRKSPSPARRLSQIEKARAQVVSAIEETAQFVGRLHGSGDRSRIGPRVVEGSGLDRRGARQGQEPQSDSRFRIGPAFDALDRLTGGHPSNARR